MSDGNLALVGQRIIAAAVRDEADLIPYGFTAVERAALNTMVMEFLDLPTDAELTGMMMEATQAKNNLEKTITTYITKEVMLRVEMEFNAGTPTYNRFGTKGIHNMTDGNFLMCIKRVARQGGLLETALASRGYTPDMTTQVSDYATDYLDAWNNQNAAIDSRDQAVEVRINKGNELYEKLAKLAELGKKLWADTSPAKYNDYVIYATPPPAAQIFDGDLEGDDGLLNLSATGVTASSVIGTEVTGAEPLTFYFAANPTDPPAPGEGITIAAGDSASNTAADLGFVSGTKEWFNVFNGTANLSSYWVSVANG